MQYEKSDLLYEGKGKKIYAVKANDDLVYMEFKDSLTAFNAQKTGSFVGKGIINHKISSSIFTYLKEQGINTHMVSSPQLGIQVCHKVEIIPLEVVVRNVLAGSTAKKFAIEEGTILSEPLVEFYYKKDELQDPFLSDAQALMLKAARSQEELDVLKQLALKINSKLLPFFDHIGIKLIDFKVEFGRSRNGEILLADEISPDSCRLWDKETNEKYDKDRFRRDLGGVAEGYQMIWSRIQKYYQGEVE